MLFLVILTISFMNTLTSHNMPGFLCAIEGIDGSGKSFLIKKLEIKFNEKNINIFITKEPGATKIGKELRNILLHQDTKICSFSEFLLFAADRAQHFQEFIIPKLTQGTLIISDRMADSSIVYQGYLKGIDLDRINTINTWCMQNIEPDLIFYLKIDPKKAQKRVLNVRGISDNFEKELLNHLDTLSNAFDIIFKNKDNVIIIDALQDSDFIANFIYNEILNHYFKKQSTYVTRYFN